MHRLSLAFLTEIPIFLGDKGEPLSSPKMLVEPEEVTENKGKTIKLSCLASGNPQPLMSWRKFNGTLPRSRHRIYITGTLELQNLKEEDSGTYVCSARSILGRRSVSMVLSVRGKL